MNFDLLIAAALKPEWAFVKKLYRFKKFSDHPLLYVADDHPQIAVLQTGIGPKRARESFFGFFLSHKTRHVFQLGTCGGLHPDLKHADLVISTSIIDEDKKIIPQKIPAHYAETLLQKKIPFHLTKTLCLTRPLGSPSEKKSAHKKFEALSIDMESAPVAKLCHEKGLFYLNARGVFDTVDETLEKMDHSCDERGELSGTGLALDLIKNPGLILQLPGFQKRLGLIQSRLMEVLKLVQTTTT